MKICVYGASSPSIDKEYIEKTEKLGIELAKRGHSLVFGGGKNGLMGAAARGVKSEGGYITGIAPKFFKENYAEVLYTFCDEFIEPDTMRERKQIMEYSSDAFIVLPGGIGTYEEFFEILTAKQLCLHKKPIAVYNINGFYNDLNTAMKSAIEKDFMKEECLDLYKTTESIDEIFEYIEAPITKAVKLKDLKEG